MKTFEIATCKSYDSLEESYDLEEKSCDHDFVIMVCHYTNHMKIIGYQNWHAIMFTHFHTKIRCKPCYHIDESWNKGQKSYDLWNKYSWVFVSNICK